MKTFQPRSRRIAVLIEKLKNELQNFSKRADGGRLVVVWSAIFFMVEIGMVGIDCRMNKKYYIRGLDSCLLPAADEIFEKKWTHEQNNAPIHTSARTNQIFEANNLDVLDWPARSAGLNAIKHVWGYSARASNQRGRH